jgi:hypothetical protein
MFRSLCSCIVAAVFVVSSTSGAMAAAWQQSYAIYGDSMYGILDENESAGMAYLRVPFGGPISRPNKATWGFSIISRLPYEFSHVRLGNRAGVATLLDLEFNGARVDDVRINGLSMNESYRRLNANGDDKSSAWVTWGIMALAAGAAAVVILAGNNQNERNTPEAIPGSARREGVVGGCGDGMGPGNGDGQGNGNLGPADDRIYIPDDEGGGQCPPVVPPFVGDGMGAGGGDMSGGGNGDGLGDGSSGGTEAP